MWKAFLPSDTPLVRKAVFTTHAFLLRCSKATIQTHFYDILIPRLTCAVCLPVYLAFQAKNSHRGWIKTSYVAVNSPKTRLYPLLFAILLMCHISKSDFYAACSQTFTEEFYPPCYC